MGGRAAVAGPELQRLGVNPVHQVDGDVDVATVLPQRRPRGVARAAARRTHRDEG